MSPEIVLRSGKEIISLVSKQLQLHNLLFIKHANELFILYLCKLKVFLCEFMAIFKGNRDCQAK